MRAGWSAVLWLILLPLAQPILAQLTYRYAVCLVGRRGDGFSTVDALNLKSSLLSSLPQASRVDAFVVTDFTADAGELQALASLAAVNFDFNLQPAQEDVSQRISGAGNCTPFLPAADTHARKWLTRWESVASCFDAVVARETHVGLSYAYVVHARLVRGYVAERLAACSAALGAAWVGVPPALF